MGSVAAVVIDNIIPGMTWVLDSMFIKCQKLLLSIVDLDSQDMWSENCGEGVCVSFVGYVVSKLRRMGFCGRDGIIIDSG